MSRQQFSVILLLCLVGCASSDLPSELTLATTTSTQDSGLLDRLLPAFERQTGISVKVVAVGSGQALELGRRGDADLLLTHSPEQEAKFMEEGYGRERRPVMQNDFVIVGPANDPAEIKSASSAVEALQRIKDSKAPYVSRGDDSGTHQKERALWLEAGIAPAGDWYVSAGAGMGQTLRIAEEMRAYALADRATYLAMQSEITSVILFEGDERLLNRYSVILISSQKHPHVHEREAARLMGFLLSEEGQDMIRSFGRERFGRPLFVPAADSLSPAAAAPKLD